MKGKLKMDIDNINNSPDGGSVQQPGAAAQPDVSSPLNIVAPVNPAEMDAVLAEPTPVVPPQVAPAQAVLSQVAPKPKSKKTGLIIGLVALGLLIAGLVGGYFWYQSPNKVIADAFDKAALAKRAHAKIKLSGFGLPEEDSLMGLSFGDVEMEIAGDIEKISFDYSMAAKLKLMGQEVPVKIKLMLVDKQDLYFYIEDISAIVNKLLDSFGFMGDASMLAELKQQFLPLIAKLENKWVKVSLSDLKSQTGVEENKSLTCLIDVFNSFDANKYAQQAKTALKKYNYYKADKVKTVEGNFVISTSIDDKKFESYNQAMLETDFMQSLTKCGKEGKSSDDGAVNKAEPASLKNTELTISRWGHELRSMKSDIEVKTTVDGEKKVQTTKVEVTMGWPAQLDIKVPSGAVDVKTWIKDLEAEMEKLTSGSGDNAVVGLGATLF